MKAFVQLLTIMEGFPASLEVKGGHVQVCGIEQMYVTCPRPPVAATF